MIKNFGMVSFVLRDFSYSGELILVRKSFKLQAARNFGYRLLGFACPPRPFLDGRWGNPSTFLCHYLSVVAANWRSRMTMDKSGIGNQRNDSMPCA